jgi:hypothetical protein
MQDIPTPEQMIYLMGQRSSSRDKTEVPVSFELLGELQDFILDKIPSTGNLRLLTLGLSVTDRLQIIATPLSTHVAKYKTNSKRLLDMEAGTLAAYINLFLLTKGYQTRYYFNNTPDGLNVRLILELAIYPKD